MDGGVQTSIKKFVVICLFLSFLIPLSIGDPLQNNEVPVDVLPDCTEIDMNVIPFTSPDIPSGRFTENRGQIQDDAFLYYALGPNLSVGFGRGWISFKVDDESSSVVRRTYVGCNDVVPVGSKPTEERSSYFIGNDPEGWVTDVRNFRELLYEDIYDGIDLRIHLTEGSLKYEFIVDPGSDPSRIQMHHEGMEDVRLLRGDLVIETVNGVIIDEAPFSYQTIKGKEILIGSEYSIDGPNVRISLEAYDPWIQLVIDPSINFSTFIGGNSRDLLRSHYVDADGNVYLTGASLSLDFPTTPGVFNRTMNMYGMAFVTKLSPDGSSLKYSTFIGGAASLGYGYAIWVDTSGNAYVTGVVQGRDFPTTPGNFSHVGDDLTNIMVFKLNPTGSALIFSSILGAKDVTSDYGYDLLVDDAGMIYIVGQTGSLGAFCPSDSYQDRTKGNGDAFVLKLAPTGKTILNCTHIGGREKDRAESIAIDSDGNVIIVGWTLSTDFPVSSNAFCSTKNGEADAFVAVFDENLTNLTYSSYYGGVYTDRANGVSVDKKDSIYITGFANRGFPTTSGAFDEVSNRSDAFVLKLNSTFGIEYSTFLGGKENEQGYSITVYDGGCALVTGNSESSDFPTTEGGINRTLTGYQDTFLTKFSPNGSEVLYSTFIGCQRAVDPYEVSVHDNGFVYLSGWTEDGGFQTTQGAYCTTYSGGDMDGFALRIDIDRPWVVVDSTLNVTTTGDPFQVNLTVRDNTDLSEVELEYWYGSSSSHTRVTMDNAGGTSTNATYVSNFTIPLDTLAKFYYIAHLTDSAGNKNSTVVSGVIVVDNDRPLMTDGTSQAPTTGETFEFLVDVFDNIHMDDVRVVYWFGDSVNQAVNVSMWGNTGNGNGLYDYDAVTIPDNSLEPLHYRFWCNDTSGNWNETGPFDLQVSDNDIPHIGDDLSDKNATTGDHLTFRINCSDNIGPAIVRIALWYDEASPVHRNLTALPLNTDGEGNGLYGLGWSVFPDAVHSIHYRFQVYDITGNVNQTVERVINVTDNDIPLFHEDGSDLSAATGEDYTFLIEASDNIDLTDVSVSFRYGESNATVVYMDLQSMQGPGRYVYSLTIHIPTIIPGQLSYHFIATDSAGNSNLSQDRTVKIDDMSPPEILDDLTDDLATTGDPFTFMVLVGDNVGVTQVTVSLSIGDDPVIHRSMQPTGAGTPNRMTYSAVVDIPWNATGSVRYSFEVKDVSSNNSTSSERSVTIRDNDPPTLTEWGTDEEIVKGSTTTITARCWDNIQVEGVWVEYWYGDGERTNSSMTLGNVYYLTLSIQRYPQGDLRYTFSAVDSSGNWNETGEWTVSLINLPPTVEPPDVWEITEEADEVLELFRYIEDGNDPPERLTLTCLAPNITVEGLELHAMYDTWMPEHVIEVTVSDGDDEVTFNITVRVVNVNDPPELIMVKIGGEEIDLSNPLNEVYEIRVGSSDTIWVLVYDEDGDELTYRWFNDGEEVANGQEIGYADLPEGEYFLNLLIHDGTAARVQDLPTILVVDPGDEVADTPIILLFMVALLAVAAVIVTLYVLSKKNESQQ